MGSFKIIFRLGSVVPNGVGGPEAAAINLIYSFSFQKFKINTYSRILINQIDDNYDEVIIRNGKKIHINIKYPAPDDFGSKTDLEKNLMRLEIIHSALLRLNIQYNEMDIDTLELIRQEVIDINRLRSMRGRSLCAER